MTNALPRRLEPSVRFDPLRKTGRPLRVALVRPPVYASRYNTSETPVPPLGLAYLASAVRNAGHDVRVIDALGEDLDGPRPAETGWWRYGIPLEEIEERLRYSPDVIGVSCMFSNDWPRVRETVRRLKKRLPSSLFVGGGEHCTALPETCLASCPELDAIVLGEGEQGFLEFLEEAAGGKRFDSVPGLAVRDGARVARTPARGRIANIDDLPPPAWDLLPLENYLRREWCLGTRRGRSIPMLATRGCPYQCTFCSSPGMWTLRWIPRSPRRVLDEFETWRNRYDVHDIQFFDLTAILNREWILSFSDEIVRRKLNITWQLPVGTRSETIDREVAAALRRSGCAYVCYAPESGSPETLDRIKKRVNLSRLKQSVGAAVSEGLSVKCNILLGFPDETHRNVRETLGFVLSMSRLGVHDVAISPFSPYPGTPLFERLQREGKLSAELPDEWYASLPYSDFGALKSYSQHFSLAFLRFYQFLGYVLFYGAGYLLRPLRFARLLRSLFAPRPDTKGATALRILVRRFFGRPSVSPIPLRSASSLSAR